VYQSSAPGHTIARDTSVMTTALLVGLFIVLLALEWRYRHWLLRATAIAASLVVMMFAQPSVHRAARVVISLPESERVLRLGDRRATDYESGILTLEQAARADAAIGAEARPISLCVLVWLATTPMLRDRHRSSRSEPS
jgi:hypothetical protein